MGREGDARKCLFTNQLKRSIANPPIWMSRDLKVFHNSEYFYAIFQIAIALFWCKGGLEIANSEPSSMIFEILAHCLNTTDINNYFARTPGRWFCLDAMLKGFPALSPLGDYSGNQNGTTPRLAIEERPSPFTFFLFALSLATIRFGEMSRGSAE